MKAAQARREAELLELQSNGIAVTRLSRWHVRINALHLWPATGWWRNEANGSCGRLYGTSIHQILQKNASSQVQRAKGLFNLYKE